jgi:hypothetical protein
MASSMDIDTEAWIIATSHQFAWWLMQEEEEMDDFTKVAHYCGECGRIYQWSADDIAWMFEASYSMPCGHLWKFLDKQIASECDIADELAVIVIQCDEIIHTDALPYCYDMTCPCHGCSTWAQVEEMIDALGNPFDAGLLTLQEQDRLWQGRQV